MTAVEFLDKLEQQGLLDDYLVSALRRQVAESPKPISARKIVKLLIDKGHLTAFQAKKLFDEGGSKPPAKTPRAESAAPAEEDDELTLVDEAVEDDEGLELVDEAEEEDDLALIDESDEPAPPAKPSLREAPTLKVPAGRPPSKPSAVPTARDDFDLVPVDEGDVALVEGNVLTPAAPTAGSARAKAPPGAPPVTPPPVGEGLELIDPLATEPVAADPLATDLAATADPMAAPLTRTRGKATTQKIRKPKGSPWDTPLIVLGGGMVILLAIGAFAMYRFLTAANASDVFQAATDAYRAESYTQAISIYESFLKKFPKDPQAGAAWVLIRTARLRQVVEGRNWDRALETAEAVLAEIEAAMSADQPPVEKLPEAFGEHGRPELASLLPAIAAGFATAAKDAANMEDAKRLAARADEAMILVNNPSYIPSSLRESVEVRIDAIQEDIAVAKRNIMRGAALAQAMADMDAALAKRDTPAAFETRKTLLKTYPELTQHPQVVEAVRKTTETEQSLVMLLEEAREPLTEDAAAEGAGVQIPTAAVKGQAAPGVEGAVVAFLARGAVYGLDASTGNVLWRRGVGLETNVHPQRVSREPAADVILVDGQSHDVIRVAGKTGELVWRLPVETAVASPVLAEGRMFVAAESGLLYEVNVETGASERQVKFPQPLRSPPAVDVARGLIVQPGEHSNLYVLSSETLDCKAAYYLGHRAGSIVAPPVLTRGQMFLAENAGADYCLIHVLPATDEAGKLKPSQNAFRLRGNVVAPPYVFDRRAVIVTDLGGIYFFEVDTGNARQPASIVAESLPTLRQPAFGYSLAEESQLWVGKTQLERYEIQAARGELELRNSRDEQSVYVAPPQKIGNVLFHARRPANSEGVVITAAAADTLRPYWTSDVGAPMVGLITDPASSRLAAVTAQGVLFTWTSLSETRSSPTSRRDAAAWEEAAFEPPLALPDGRFVFPGAAQKNRILLFDPQAAASPKAVELQCPEGRATAAPVAFQGGLLVPSSAGRVYLADPETGKGLALPFRPPLAPGEEVVWQSPAVTADGKEFVIASDQKKAYRVALRQQPQPHLAALSTRELDGVIVSRLAAAGDTIYGVERTSQRDTLLAFQLPALSFQRLPLSDRLAWGPHPVGESILLATYESLVCVDGGGQPRWTRPLPYGPPVAPPGEWNGDYLFASVGGVVWSVAAETGEEASKTVLGHPLAAGPAVAGQQLVLGGSDGLLHIVPLGE